MQKFQFLYNILANLIRNPPPQAENKSNFFYNSLLGPFSKIGDQIWMHEVKDHGFPSIKWCDLYYQFSFFGC